MKNKLKGLLKILILSAILLAIPTTQFAHSGRTDSSGGHKDNKNVSGLGSYHYHCGGNPAHLHEGGVCPYGGSAKSTITQKSKSNNTSTKSNSKSTSTSTKTTTETNESSSTTNNSANQNIEVENVVLNSLKRKIEINEELTITATIMPDLATDKTITWKSSDESIATVSDTGVVKAIKAGSVSISATSKNGKYGTINITVNTPKIDVTELNLDESDLALEAGKENRIVANILPYESTDKTIKWTSSDSEVARVENGKVIALKAGEVTITAETANGITKTCHVKVAEPAKSAVTQNSTENNTSATLGGVVLGAGIVGAGVLGFKKLKK